MTPLDKIGFLCFKLNGDAVFRLKARMEGQIGKLEDFDSENFTQEHVKLTKKLHEMWEWKEIIEENADRIKHFAGISTLLYQKEPYLRIARSFVREDNIGIHRDTHYGATTDEWVLWIPLTAATAGGELKLIAGSHNEGDDVYPWTQEPDPTVEVGSDKHWLGFRYAPKKMSKETEDKCSSVPCFLGEAILFNSGCVHGQIVNRAPWTRFSIDIRVCDVNANVQKTRGLHGEIYASL